MATTDTMVGIRLHPDTRAELEAVAANAGATLSAAARQMIELGLAHRQAASRELSAERRGRTQLRNGRPKRKHGRPR